MDGRATLACVFGLLLAGAGCVHTNTSAPSAPGTPQVSPSEMANLPPSSFPEESRHAGKRVPKASTVVAMAAMKEGEGDKLEKDPDLQHKVRDQARILYQEALKLDEKNAEALGGLIRVYVHLDDLAKAREVIARGQHFYPKDPTFWIESARVHNRKKEFADAVKDLNKAVEFDPENRRAQTQLGLTLARLGKYDQALPPLTRSLGAAAAHYTIARMMIHLNQDAAARPHLEQTLALNPNHQGARELLEGMTASSDSAPRPELQLVE